MKPWHTRPPQRVCARWLIHLCIAIAVAVGSAGTAFAAQPPAQPADAPSCPQPPHVLAGSFLQPPLADSWSTSEWTRELATMNAVCMDTLVLQWTADSHDKTTVFPSDLPGYRQTTSHDVVDRALSTADRLGLHVWLGLNTNGDWWSKFGYDRDWLLGETATAKTLIDELEARYRHHESLAGWYLTFEVWNQDEPDPAKREALDQNLAEGLGDLATHAHKATGRPVMTAPFFNAAQPQTLPQWQQMWRTILTSAPIDIIALQDGVGAEHATAQQLPLWFDATRQAISQVRPATQLWSDTETYTIADWRPMGINQIVDDMAAVAPYVSRHLSFSFNHYLSPQQVNPLYFDTYAHYVRTGQRDLTAPSPPSGVQADAVTATSVRLHWTSSPTSQEVVGYRVYRDGALMGKAYDGATTFSDACLAADHTYSYQISAYDAAGNNSAPSSATQVTTPAKPAYPDDLASGRPYTASTPASTSYPDTDGTELTDGQFGTTDFQDPRWQGRLTSTPFNFVIDLGSTRTIHEISTHLLQVRSAAITLPISVTYSVSDDGQTYTPVGAAPSCGVTPEDQTKSYALTGLDNLDARYVRAEVTPSGAWTFLDEIEVR